MYDIHIFMRMRFVEVQKYCKEKYGIIITQPVLDRLMKDKEINNGIITHNVDDIIEYCEKLKECKDNGYLTIKELRLKIEEIYNIKISAEMIYGLNPQLVKISRHIIYVKDWQRILDYYKLSRGERVKQTLIKLYGVTSTPQLDKSKKTRENKWKDKTNVSRIAKELKKDSSTIERIIKHLNIKPIKTTDSVIIYDKSIINDVRNFLEEHNYDTYSFFYKNTCKEKYGVENVSQSDEIKKKKEQTSLKNYGVSHYMKLEKYQNKMADICKNNAEKRYEKRKETVEKLIYDFEQENDCISVNHLNEKMNFGYDRCGRFSEIIHKIGINYLIYENNMFIYNKDVDKILNYRDVCHDHLTSYFENEIADFIKSIYTDEIITNSRNVISPKELDIYIPNKKVGIECNGLYWHSEIRCDKNFHLNKTISCEEKGIRLIQLFEDEWTFKKDICKSIISSSLGIYQQKIFARKCICKEVNSESAREFLNKNHIQGFVNSKFNFGLYYNDELVQLVTFGKNRFKNNEIELLRMCTKLNTQVVGGFSKLIKYALNFINIDEFISYVDRRLFNAKGYISSGFEIIGESKPSYFYTKGIRRENRLKYQKHKLPKLLKEFNPSLSEKENMLANKFHIIYDCGTLKLKYKKY